MSASQAGTLFAAAVFVWSAIGQDQVLNPLHMAQIFGYLPMEDTYLLHLVKGEGEQTEEEPVLKPETVEMLTHAGRCGSGRQEHRHGWRAAVMVRQVPRKW